LFQAVQPMNDIVTAALWVAAVAAALGATPSRAWRCGALMGHAVLVRPNLAQVAIVLAVAVTAGSGDRLRALRHLLVAMAPGLAVLLWLNDGLYGSPFATGYGGARELFAAGYLGANLAHYSRAWYETQTAFALLAVAAPFVLVPAARPAAWTVLATAGAVLTGYLLYRPYPEWWYLRFLMPAVVLATALATAVTVRALPRRGGLSHREHPPAPLLDTRVAFVRAAAGGAKGQGGSDLWIRSLADGQERRIAHDAVSIGGVSWAPDGAHLAFGGGAQSIRHEQAPEYSGAKILYTITQRTPSQAFVVPSAGGSPTAIGAMGAGALRWIDARRVAFDRQSPDFKRRTVFVADITGSAPKPLREDVDEKFWSILGGAGAAAQPSPDGKCAPVVDHRPWPEAGRIEVSSRTIEAWTRRVACGLAGITWFEQSGGRQHASPSFGAHRGASPGTTAAGGSARAAERNPRGYGHRRFQGRPARRHGHGR